MSLDEFRDFFGQYTPKQRKSNKEGSWDLEAVISTVDTLAERNLDLDLEEEAVNQDPGNTEVPDPDAERKLERRRRADVLAQMVWEWTNYRFT